MESRHIRPAYDPRPMDSLGTDHVDKEHPFSAQIRATPAEVTR